MDWIFDGFGDGDGGDGYGDGSGVGYGDGSFGFGDGDGDGYGDGYGYGDGSGVGYGDGSFGFGDGDDYGDGGGDGYGEGDGFGGGECFGEGDGFGGGYGFGNGDGIGSAQETAATALAASTREIDMQIAILDRGFVYVGRCAVDDTWLTITDAQNIRRWGTTGGLGQLAADGPQPETVLDPTGTVRVPLRSLIALIDCAEASWT